MERLSSKTILTGGTELVGLVSRLFGLRFGQFSSWFRDKNRQIRSLPGNDELIRAVLSAERSPVEGARYRVGECINVYQPDGECRRLKICGIQSGGFSNVYTVIDLDEMRPYCLKENRALPGDERQKNERLAVEAEISLRLGLSPNLVTTYAAIFYRSRLFILTEYLSSNSLDQYLKTSSLNLKTALSYGVQLSGAVRHAQETLPGFVHRDIKPGNCFITAEGKLKLGDFGLASADGIRKRFAGGHLQKEYFAGKSDTSIGWGGTAAYMAPEMFDKTAPDRSKADVYAFGVTLFEMLCGTRPFIAASKEEIIEMHRHSEPPMRLLDVKGVPRPIMDLVERCLAKSPADRPESFDCIENELRQSLLDQFDLPIPIDPVPELNDSEIVRRAFSLACLGNCQEATACLDDAIRHRGRSPEMLASKAIALTLGTRMDDAYEASTSALMTHADSFVVFLAHGQTLIARGDLDTAEQYLLRALQLRPNNCFALNLIGNLYLRTEQYDEAASYFKRSRSLDASQTEPWEGIAISNFFEGKIQKSINLLQKALAMDPRRTELHRRLGDAYNANNQLVEAITSYKAALGLLPLSKETARRFVRSCIELYKQNGYAINVRLTRILIRGTWVFTDANRRRGSSDDFTNKFISVIQESNFNPLLLFFLDGALTRVVDRLDAAVSQELVEILRMVFERCSSGPVPMHVLNSLGRIFYYLEEYEKCRIVFRTILERFGPNENSFYYLAACSEIDGDFRASLKYYKKALRLENCEDTRTGIQRVSGRIKQIESKAANSLN